MNTHKKKYFIFLSILCITTTSFTKNSYAVNLPDFSSKKRPVSDKTSETKIVESSKSEKFAWINEKAEILQSNIEIAIENGNFEALKMYQKSCLDRDFSYENYIEMDQLIACMVEAIKKNEGPKKLNLVGQFIDYCDQNKIKNEPFFDYESIKNIRLLALVVFDSSSHKIFEKTFIINPTVSQEEKKELYNKKSYWCKDKSSQECILCYQFENTMKKALSK